MLEHYFVRPSTIDRFRASWMAPQIERYVEWMESQGYHPRNFFRRVPILCHFADFAQQRGCMDLVSASSCVEAFVSFWVSRHGTSKSTTASLQKLEGDAGNPVRQTLQLAIDGHVTPNRHPHPFPFEAAAPGFIGYLREERGLQESTIYLYHHALKRFAKYLSRIEVTALSELSPPLLASFVVDQAPQMSPSGRRDLCGRLRVFLRFCHRERITTQDFSGRGLVLDLSTSTLSVLPLFYGGQVIRASADGSHVYSAALDNSGGEVYTIDPSTYAVQSEQFGQMFWSDLAVSPDGSQFAAVDAPPGYAGSNVGFFNSSLQYLNTNVYPDSSPPDDSGVIGATFSPEGTVLVVPLGDSIELWDSAKGTLRARVMTPEELQVIPSTAVSPMIALNSTGQTIYAISASGLTVLTLPEPLDQMTPVQWPLHRPGNVGPALHRPLASRVAAIQANQEILRPTHPTN